MAKNLAEYEALKTGIIKAVLENPISAKLAEFGFLPGAVFSILNRAPFDGPIFVEIENIKVALRRQDAAFILVE